MKKLLILLNILLIGSPAWAGQQKFVTMYPAPNGVYDRLRLPPQTDLVDAVCDNSGSPLVGMMYMNLNGELKICTTAGGAGTWNSVMNVWAKNTNNIWLNNSELPANAAWKVGIGVAAPLMKLHLKQDGGILAEGTLGSGAQITTPGAGTRFFWYPYKGALRAGGVTGTQWDHNNIGNYSVALGYNNLAPAPNSTVLGGDNNSVISSAQWATIAGGTGNVVDAGGATGTFGYSGRWAFIGGGENNKATSYATVGGGKGNQAQSNWDFIGGGANNRTIIEIMGRNANLATIGGGENNIAGQYHTFVGGGYGNWSDGTISAIAGGKNNRATAGGSFIGAGENNEAQAIGTNAGRYSTVAGGNLNKTQNEFSTIAGGQSNITSGQYSSIGGGANNSASGNYSTISGGSANTTNIDATHPGGASATIAGGTGNKASGQYAFIGGGILNTTNLDATTVGGDSAVIGGGRRNKASGNYSFIGGGGGSVIGDGNTASGLNSVISGGQKNLASGQYSSVLGGMTNTASNDYAIVGGGGVNTASGVHSTVGGGGNNTASGGYATIAGGDAHTASGLVAVVGGGSGNNASADYATVAGGEANNANGNWTIIAGGEANRATGLWSFVGGGHSNITGGLLSMVPGGDMNQANGDYSFAAGQGMVLSNTADYSFAWGASDSQLIINQPNAFIIFPGGTGPGANGDVAIGTDNPAGFKLAVNGTAANTTGTWAILSDGRLKRDIKPLNGTLDKILQLKGVSFEWNNPAEHGNRTGAHKGFVAQDVEQVFPEWVGTTTDGYKYIETEGISAVLVESIKEMHQKMNEQERIIEQQQKEIEELKKLFKNL